ncbi:MAG: ATP-grasp domain-containing protein [Clostridia bacterium]|nr:ATP-grasp domain-containing protein [Clostridia bacterium]
MKDFFPIILGSDENAYGNCRLFAELIDEKPLIMCSFQLYATRHSDILDCIVTPNFDTDTVFVSALLSVLREKKKYYKNVAVIPCSDRYLQLLSIHYGEFEGLIANSFISPDLLGRLDTKDTFYALCESLGLDYPKTVVAGKDEWGNALSETGLKFPLVVKPENSNGYDYLHAHFDGKKKVYFVNSPDEYGQIIKNMSSSTFAGKLIIQEFIPGGDEYMRVMNCYSDKNGKVKFMCLGQPVLEEYAPATIGNYAAIISRSDREIYEKIENFLNGLGYVGYSNFDMKFDRRTGKYMLFEINPRMGRSSYFVRGTGRNLMEYVMRDVLGSLPDGTTYSDAVSLWTEIPKCTLLKYVKNPELKKEIKSLYRKKKVCKTLFNPADRDLKRNLAITKRYYSFIKAYRKFYFEKDG